MSTVLVIGSGGREHALAWKLSRSSQVTRVIVAPGNDGMEFPRWPADFGKGRPEFERLAALAQSEGIALTVVGPDNPLSDGIVDVFEAHSLQVFGPTAKAAQIEASKAFAKEVMQAAGVETARAYVATTGDDARNFLKAQDWSKGGWVVKADGLALGKGVHVCPKLEQALHAVDVLPKGSLVIEELLSGEELSWMAFCDGENCALLEPARDHKRLSDGDLGPNTGGMGAYSPVPGVPPSWPERVREKVFLPILREMKRRGTPFRGVLFAGLMVDMKRDRISVLEFNARFGDPETQALMLRIEGDIYPWFESVASGSLAKQPLNVPFSKDYAVTVVGAAHGYPDTPRTGDAIDTGGLAAPECFFAGVVGTPEKLKTKGGRVLATTGTGPTLEAARASAYSRLKQIRFEGMQFRRDIGGSAR